MAFAALRVTCKTRHTHSRQEVQQGYKPLLEKSRQSNDVSEVTSMYDAKLPLVGLTTKTAQEVAELRTCTPLVPLVKWFRVLRIAYVYG